MPYWPHALETLTESLLWLKKKLYQKVYFIHKFTLVKEETLKESLCSGKRRNFNEKFTLVKEETLTQNFSLVKEKTLTENLPW